MKFILNVKGNIVANINTLEVPAGLHINHVWMLCIFGVLMEPALLELKVFSFDSGKLSSTSFLLH